MTVSLFSVRNLPGHTCREDSSAGSSVLERGKQKHAGYVYNVSQHRTCQEDTDYELMEPNCTLPFNLDEMNKNKYCVSKCTCCPANTHPHISFTIYSIKCDLVSLLMYP